MLLSPVEAAASPQLPVPCVSTSSPGSTAIPSSPLGAYAGQQRFSGWDWPDGRLLTRRAISVHGTVPSRLSKDHCTGPMRTCIHLSFRTHHDTPPPPTALLYTPIRLVTIATPTASSCNLLSFLSKILGARAALRSREMWLCTWSFPRHAEEYVSLSGDRSNSNLWFS